MCMDLTEAAQSTSQTQSEMRATWLRCLTSSGRNPGFTARTSQWRRSSSGSLSSSGRVFALTSSSGSFRTWRLAGSAALRSQGRAGERGSSSKRALLRASPAGLAGTLAFICAAILESVISTSPTVCSALSCCCPPVTISPTSKMAGRWSPSSARSPSTSSIASSPTWSTAT